MKTIDADALAVLHESTIEGNLLLLPPRQLERKLYEKVNKVLTALGGKWTRKLKGHVFASDPRALIDAAAGTGTYVDKKVDLGFFETPKHIAKRMAELADLRRGDVILEPSAGKGRLILDLPVDEYVIDAVELDRDNVAYLRDQTSGRTDVHIISGDFLEIAPMLTNWGGVDVVLMNPPFANNQDIKFIGAAFETLRPGGVLVAVLSEHPFFATDKLSVNFRHFLDVTDSWQEKLPEGSFKESGTMVNTRLLTVRKAA